MLTRKAKSTVGNVILGIIVETGAALALAAFLCVCGWVLFTVLK